MEEVLDVVDWWVWEDINTAHVMNDDTSGVHKITPAEEVTEIIPKNESDKITLILPISRYRENYTQIDLPTPIRLRFLLEQIYKFYDQNLDLATFHTLKPTDDDYYIRVKKKLENGHQVKILDLIGTRGVGPFPGSVPEGERRSPFFCNGLVRFEGLEKSQESPDTFIVQLGS